MGSRSKTSTPWLASLASSLRNAGLMTWSESAVKLWVKLLRVDFELGRHRYEQEIDALLIEQLFEFDDHGQWVLALALLLEIPATHVLEVVAVEQSPSWPASALTFAGMAFSLFFGHHGTGATCSVHFPRSLRGQPVRVVPFRQPTWERGLAGSWSTAVQAYSVPQLLRAPCRAREPKDVVRGFALGLARSTKLGEANDRPPSSALMSDSVCSSRPAGARWHRDPWLNEGYQYDESWFAQPFTSLRSRAGAPHNPSGWRSRSWSSPPRSERPDRKARETHHRLDRRES